MLKQNLSCPRDDIYRDIHKDFSMRLTAYAVAFSS